LNYNCPVSFSIVHRLTVQVADGAIAVKAWYSELKKHGYTFGQEPTDWEPTGHPSLLPFPFLQQLCT
jgi:hypothetical protein